MRSGLPYCTKPLPSPPKQSSPKAWESTFQLPLGGVVINSATWKPQTRKPSFSPEGGPNSPTGCLRKPACPSLPPAVALGGSISGTQNQEDVVGTGMGYAHSTVTSARQQSPKARSVLSCSVRLCFLFMTRQTWAPSVPELPLLEETPRRCVLRASIRFHPRPQRRTQAWPPK